MVGMVSDGGGDGELWVLIVVMVAVGGKERKRGWGWSNCNTSWVSIYIYIYIMGLIWFWLASGGWPPWLSLAPLQATTKPPYKPPSNSTRPPPLAMMNNGFVCLSLSFLFYFSLSIFVVPPCLIYFACDWNSLFGLFLFSV